MASMYIRMVSVAYGAKGIILLSSSLLNVMRRPLFAAAVNVAQMFVVFIPLALLGNLWFGIYGIFAALTVSLFIAGSAAWFLAKGRLDKISLQDV